MAGTKVGGWVPNHFWETIIHVHVYWQIYILGDLVAASLAPPSPGTHLYCIRACLYILMYLDSGYIQYCKLWLLSACSLLIISYILFTKRMRLIGVVFYEPDLESMWSPGIFGEVMATNNTSTVMQEDRVSEIASTYHLERQL